MTKEEAIERFHGIIEFIEADWTHDEEFDKDMEAIKMAIELLKQEIKIVHCKECKYSHMTASGDCKYCDIHFPNDAAYYPGDYFCADGER